MNAFSGESWSELLILSYFNQDEATLCDLGSMRCTHSFTLERKISVKARQTEKYGQWTLAHLTLKILMVKFQMENFLMVKFFIASFLMTNF